MQFLPRHALPLRGGVLLAMLCGVLVLSPVKPPQPSEALFLDAQSVAPNTLAADTLAAPTGLTITNGTGTVALSWTATTSSFAAGYKVYRSDAAGGPFTEFATVAGRATTTWTDTTPGTTAKYYLLKAYDYNWLSGQASTGPATPVVATSDTFSGTGALNVTESGAFPWLFPNGATWSRSGGLAQTTTAMSSNPMAVVDAARANVAVTVPLNSGGGQAAYLRVQDGSNWLRARSRHYQTSSQYTYYTTQYEWADASNTMEYEYTDHYYTSVYDYSTYTASGWNLSTDNCVAGTTPAGTTFSNWNANAGVYQDKDVVGSGTTGCSGGQHPHQHYKQTVTETKYYKNVDTAGSNYWATSPSDSMDVATGNTRYPVLAYYWGDSCGYTNSANVYVNGCNDPHDYKTGNTRQTGPYTGTNWTDNYEIVVEKDTAGTITTLATYPLGTTPPTSLKFTCKDTTLTVYANGSGTATGTLTEAAFATATKHGIGIAGPNFATPTGIDSFNLVELP